MMNMGLLWVIWRMFSNYVKRSHKDYHQKRVAIIGNIADSL